MSVIRTRARNLGALAIAMLLTGCLSPAERSDHDMTQATAAPLPPADAAAAAPDLLANAGLTLPDEATDVEVDLVNFENFREISITRFTAPHGDATTMCIEAGRRPTEERAEFITAYEGGMLGRFSLEPGMTGCEVWADSGTGARVFISAEDPAHVTVLIYRLPSR